MVTNNTSRGSGSSGHLFTWVDHTLRPVGDSPPAGTYDAVGATDLKSCPVCGHTMREHTIDHTAHDTILNCPVPHPGAWDRDAFEPVNEFGMVMHHRQPSAAGDDSDE
jgi:hypothetical protein